MSDDLPPCEFYLISPEKLDPESFAALLEKTLAAGSVSCFQLRLPDADEDEIRVAAKTLAPLVWKYDIPFLLCDHVQLTKELDLDGVHLENDLSAKMVKAARKLLGNDKSIGVSCRNSRHLAMELGEAGADYVSFGPVFMSPTKDLPPMEDAMEAIRWWGRMMELPQVAIGGVSPENCDMAVAAGADFIAGISSIWSAAEGPEAAMKQFAKALSEANSR
ncbi:thiamine phosphate synthase [Aestuariispira insulae]|uniref:Thiamine-phosphate synthase n=1 Tax=Aestuariispira insulae TaxID=1461337 RepID=A0A3D9HJX0_9PROT|nr:thiamine phosphate synthase [Aestuariispira insulae]RED49768.1 thiamine-phosphate diphosphorylase [Aestuariispira insulae]